MKTLCAALVSLIVLTACTSGKSTSADGLRWQSPLLTEHPLIGRIWDVHAQAFISEDALLQALGTADIAILGEKHDNPDHHAIQRRLLAGLTQAQALASVSFEMLDSSQQSALDSLAGVDLGEEETVRSHLRWDEDGWDWALYGPLVLDAARANIPLRAANISMDEMRAVYAEPLAAVVAEALGEAQLERLHREIDESHCGMLPQSQFPAMVRVQQARDAAMAASLDSAAEGVRVLIAGNFHARHDLGVSNYLPETAGTVLSLGILEVSAQLTDPPQYLQEFVEVLPHDYVWFTPAVSAEDYCASLREGREQTALNESGNRSGN
jgi:uncharacterized iron-regulated protein